MTAKTCKITEQTKINYSYSKQLQSGTKWQDTKPPQRQKNSIDPKSHKIIDYTKQLVRDTIWLQIHNKQLQSDKKHQQWDTKQIHRDKMTSGGSTSKKNETKPLQKGCKTITKTHKMTTKRQNNHKEIITEKRMQNSCKET